MFSDDYRSDMDKIKPDDSTKAFLYAKLQDAARVPSADRVPSRRLWRYVGAAAAVALTLGIWGIIPTHPGQVNAPVAEITSSQSSGSAVSTQSNTSPAGKSEVTLSVTKATTSQSGTSYSKIYSYLKDHYLQLTVTEDNAVGSPARPGSSQIVNGGAQKPATGETADSSKGNYSETNTQVNGVDEADIVKTDGNYVYRLNNNAVTILSVNGSKMKVAATIKQSDKTVWFQELYVAGNRLVIIGHRSEPVNKSSGLSGTPKVGAAAPAIAYDCVYSEGDTVALVYDITDRSAPKRMETLVQDGNYLSSRLIGNMLYLISNHTIYGQPDKNKPDTFVPSVGTSKKTVPLSADSILMAKKPEGGSYVVVRSLNISTAKQADVQAILGSGSTFYCGSSELLIASPRYSSNSKKVDKNTTRYHHYSYTDLLYLSLNNGSIMFKKSGTVPGTLLNQFSMDYYQENFRLVTTLNENEYEETISGGVASMTKNTSKNTNAMYILDKSLQIVSKIENVAPGERVYSVRFDGDIGYFVTFRQVDPLFAVDLSNPLKPKILSALKIPGFSDYLHPFAKGLLLGLGRNGDDNGLTGGLRLSMFDVSDPTDVTEKHKLPLDVDYSTASYNHKAILVSAQRNLIAFPGDDQRYLVYGYSSAKGFYKKADIRLVSGKYSEMRGLFINDFFYVSGENTLSCYSLSNFKLLDTLQYS